jgi:hypothetical protein
LLQIKISRADSVERPLSTPLADVVEPRGDFDRSNALSVPNLGA